MTHQCSSVAILAQVFYLASSFVQTSVADFLLACNHTMPIHMWIGKGPLLADRNLSGFLAFMNSASTEISFRMCVLRWVCSINHKSSKRRSQISVEIDGQDHSLPGINCDDPDCTRCNSCHGGYEFPWISPLWTKEWWANVDFFFEGVPSHMVTGPEWRRRIVEADETTRTRGENNVEGYADDWERTKKEKQDKLLPLCDKEP